MKLIAQASVAMAVSVLIGVSVLAVEQPAAPAAPASQPAAQGADDRVSKLIAQLGDDDFKVREEASASLKSMGKPALPALRQAMASTDPEVRQRASAIVKELDPVAPPAQPVLPPGAQFRIGHGQLMLQGGGRVVIQGPNGQQIIIPGNNARGQIIMPPNGGGAVFQLKVVNHMNMNGVRDINVNENGREVHIHQDNTGILVSLKEPNAEKAVETRAKDAQDLEKNHPDAYKIYKQYAGEGNGGMIKFEAVPQLILPQQ